MMKYMCKTCGRELPADMTKECVCVSDVGFGMPQKIYWVSDSGLSVGVFTVAADRTWMTFDEWLKCEDPGTGKLRVITLTSTHPSGSVSVNHLHPLDTIKWHDDTDDEKPSPIDLEKMLSLNPNMSKVRPQP